jgi:hypothetical protein
MTSIKKIKIKMVLDYIVRSVIKKTIEKHIKEIKNGKRDKNACPN